MPCDGEEIRRHDVVVIAGARPVRRRPGPGGSLVLVRLHPGVLRAMRLPSRAHQI